MHMQQVHGTVSQANIVPEVRYKKKYFNFKSFPFKVFSFFSDLFAEIHPVGLLVANKQASGETNAMGRLLSKGGDGIISSSQACSSRKLAIAS